MAFDPNKLPKLQNFLNYYTEGHMGDGGGMNQEMYDYYQGDEMLKMLQQFDPSASWEYNDNMTGGGEGGPSGVGGYKLNYNHALLPKSKFGDEFIKPVKDKTEVYDDKYVYDDENYGKITLSKNVKKPKDPMWTKLAPLAVGMGGPMIGAALAGAGIGGAAGLTSSVTGSGMGAAAGGMLGKGIGGAVKALPGFARNVSSGNWAGAGMSALGAGAGVMGGLGGTLGHVGQGLSTVGKWLPLANAAAGMMRRK